MNLEHVLLKPFEPVITELYNVAFATEKAAKVLVFPSQEAYISAYLRDYNKAQNLIAVEIIETYEKQSTLKENEKVFRREAVVDKEAIAGLKSQFTVLANRILVLRKLLDSVAFSLFDNKLYIAKRFIQHKRLSKVNIDAIKVNLEAANMLNDNNKLEFALVSDLTTFIEVGDLIWRINRNGKFMWLIVELKTGHINVELVNLIDQDDKVDPDAIEKMDPDTKRQLERILRQKDRTKKIVELINTNKGEDFRTGMKLEIKEDPISWTFYDKKLHNLALAAKHEQVALGNIEECFYIFASTLPDEETAHYFYHIINPGADCKLEGSDEESAKEIQECRNILSHPYVKDLMLNNLYARWRTPFFKLPIEEVMFDLLFQRMRILLYLDIDKFLKLCTIKGLQVEFLSKKESNIIKAKMPQVPLYNGLAIKLVSNSGKAMNIGDGLFNRLFYDLVTPSTLLDILMASIN